jgi:uncharacterized membrane protein
MIVNAQQPTNCIWMKAKSKQDMTPEKNKMDKNDVQRTNKSRRIHGLEFEKACLLFILVRVSWIFYHEISIRKKFLHLFKFY